MTTIAENTYEQQQAMNHEEYVLELWCVYKEIWDWMHQDREINEDDRSIIEYRGWEDVFDTNKKTMTIKQYFDWDYNPVSRLVLRDNESVWKFMERAEELNEKLWETITFEDR